MNHSDHLTELDRRILSVLQRDASLSAAELARRVDSSAATCWRRVQALEAAGILGPAVRLVDPKAVGRTLEAWCSVRLKSQDAATRQAFQRGIEGEPAILEVYSMSGEWDYLLHLLVRDIADFEDILMRRVLGLASVGGTASHFVLRRLKHTTEVPV